MGLVFFGSDVLMAQADANPAKTKNPADPATMSWRKNRKTAKKLIKKGNQEAAVPYLEAGYGKKAKKVYFAQNLSEIELNIRDYKSANKWYKVLVDKDSARNKKPAYLFQYALTQKYLSQYDDAIANFARYKKLAGEDDESVDMKKRATHEIDGCVKGIFQRDSVNNREFKTKRLDANINQANEDFAAMMKDNGLYYSSNPGIGMESYARIYKSLGSGKSWGKGETLGDNVNMPKANVSAPAFSADGNTMYYTLCKEDASSHKQKCSIYMARLANGVWEKGSPVSESVNDPMYNNMQPSVGKNKDNEDVLYFVSDRNPGKGLDIFYAKINNDGSLSKPRSAGPQINSKGDDVSPFYDAKSKTLYFSSNGWVNIGGLDVFKSTLDPNGEWMEPENLGLPVNSSADDLYFSINEKGTLGFVTSNRPGGFATKCETCSDDIYQVETTKIFLAVTGTVYEEKDNNRLISETGKVTLYDEKNGTDLGSYNLINGNYFFNLEPKRSYKVLSRHEGSFDAVAPFNTDNNTESDTLKYDLFFKKKEMISADQPLIGRMIGRVYYDYNKSKLRDDARDTLKSVMEFINKYPNAVIEVGGHTDSKGTEQYNLSLSRRRAEAVANYFIYSMKVAPERFVTNAYGSTQPVALNTAKDGSDNPDGRALNRRTEFKVIDELKPGMAKGKKADVKAMAKPNESTPKPKAENKVAPAPRPALPPAKAADKKESAAPAKPNTEKEAPIAKVKTKDIVYPKPTTAPKPVETKTMPTPAVTPGKPAEKKEAAPAKAATENKTTKEDMAPKAEAKKEVKKTAPATEGYKSTPAESITIKGTVYTEKNGSKLIAAQAAVFLTTNEGGFQQKVFYVKENGTFSFDLSHTTADNFKLIARKYQFESTETTFTLEDLKASNKPIDLIIKMK